MEQRTIRVFEARGSNNTVLNSSASTWNELKSELGAEDINYHGHKAVISDTEVTLESDEAQLPEGDFLLMLLPQRVKSGASKDFYNAMRALAKEKGIVTELPNHKTTTYEKVLGNKFPQEFRKLQEKYGISNAETTNSTTVQAAVGKDVSEEVRESLQSALGNIKNALNVLEAASIVTDPKAELIEELKQKAANIEANL